jgi:hypothetical protein
MMATILWMATGLALRQSLWLCTSYFLCLILEVDWKMPVSVGHRHRRAISANEHGNDAGQGSD